MTKCSKRHYADQMAESERLEKAAEPCLSEMQSGTLPAPKDAP